MRAGDLIGLLAFAVVAYLVGRYLIGPFSRSAMGRRHLAGAEAYALPVALTVILLGFVVLLSTGPRDRALETLWPVIVVVAAVLALPAMLGVYVGRRHWS